MRASRTRGMSLVELIVSFTILLILTMTALPLARVRIQPTAVAALTR